MSWLLMSEYEQLALMKFEIKQLEDMLLDKAVNDIHKKELINHLSQGSIELFQDYKFEPLRAYGEYAKFIITQLELYGTYFEDKYKRQLYHEA